MSGSDETFQPFELKPYPNALARPRMEPLLVRPDPTEEPPLSETPPTSRWSRVRRIVGRLRYLGLPLVMVIFAMWGARVIPGWRYQMNPDGVSYLSIASKYLAGHFADAANAYWSPLYSWLLAGLMGAGVESLLATKVLAIIIGEAILATVWWLGANLKLARDIRLLVCLTLCPILIHFGMYVTTPDLLVTAAVLLYLAQMTSASYEDRWYSRAVSGLLGAVAYLAKAYALPFFLMHFTLVNAVDFARNRGERKRVLVTAVIGYVTFAIFAGIWAACLTQKYGYFTYGSTGKFNLAWNGPNFKVPMASQGFLAPPDELATSAWDDATRLKVETWDPFGTEAERAHFRKNRERNWNALVQTCANFTWYLWPILIAGAICAGTGGDPAPRRPGFIVLSALVLYPLGYYCLHVEQRFLSQMCVMLLVIGAWAISAVGHAWGFGPVRRIVATCVLCASFLHVTEWEKKLPPLPAGQTEHAASTKISRMLGRWSVANGWGTAREFKEMSDKLRGILPEDARVASAGNWGAGLYVSHHLGLRYWGDAAPNASADQVLIDLKSREIEYFLVWGDPQRYPFLATLTRVDGDRVNSLRIYRLPIAAAPTNPSTQPVAVSD